MQVALRTIVYRVEGEVREAQFTSAADAYLFWDILAPLVRQRRVEKALLWAVNGPLLDEMGFELA